MKMGGSKLWIVYDCSAEALLRTGPVGLHRVKRAQIVLQGGIRWVRGDHLFHLLDGERKMACGGQRTRIHHGDIRRQNVTLRSARDGHALEQRRFPFRLTELLVRGRQADLSACIGGLHSQGLLQLENTFPGSPQAKQHDAQGAMARLRGRDQVNKLLEVTTGRREVVLCKGRCAGAV